MDSIDVDVLVVGAGPAGLATAIALKRRGFGGSVMVLDKAHAPGNHILSGAVIDPSCLAELLTDGEIAAMPAKTTVTRESFRFILNQGTSVKIPWVPPFMRSRGFPLGSLSKIVCYLTKIARDLGVEVYSGFAVTGLIERDGVVIGAHTGEKGGPGETVIARHVVLAEGASGILTDRLIAQKNLGGPMPQSYALAIKELIELDSPIPNSAGTIMHTFGYPVDLMTYGGGFVYHVSDREAMVGYAVGLDYTDPALNPYDLFCRFKNTEAIKRHIAGGKAVQYGAKLIPEGGFHALPKMHAPGVLIVGDGAGLVDSLRIKGVHIAIMSGIAAAKAIVGGGDVGENYERLLKATKGYADLRRVRNVHGGFTYGAPVGVAMAGFAWATFGKFPFGMIGRKKSLTKARHGAIGKSDEARISTSVFLSGTRHDESQPCHLTIRDNAKCEICAERYGSPCTRFCPAGVYRREENRLQIDFSNCLHCKTCKVKCPFENVDWRFPLGGDGPRWTRL